MTELNSGYNTTTANPAATDATLNAPPGAWSPPAATGAATNPFDDQHGQSSTGAFGGPPASLRPEDAANLPTTAPQIGQTESAVPFGERSEEQTIPRQEYSIPQQEQSFAQEQQSTLPQQQSTLSQQKQSFSQEHQSTLPQRQSTLPQHQSTLPQHQSTLPQQEQPFSQQEQSFPQQDQSAFSQQHDQPFPQQQSFPQQDQSLSQQTQPFPQQDQTFPQQSPPIRAASPPQLAPPASLPPTVAADTAPSRAPTNLSTQSPVVTGPNTIPLSSDSGHGAAAPYLPPRAEHQGGQDTPASPQLATLRAMFPDFDDSLLQSVLDSVGGDEGRAIDALLGMSDPDYRPEQQPGQQDQQHPQQQQQQQPQPPMSQTDLDEQFARQLMLQEQEQAEQQQGGYQSHRWQAPGQGGGYPAGQGHDPRQQQQQHPGQQGDTMAEITTQINKFAETGKKTFGTLFSKVKAKLNEMDQPRPNQGQGPSNVPHRHQTMQQQQEQFDYQQQPYQQQPQPPAQPQPRQSRSQAQRNDNNPPWIEQAEHYGQPQQSLGGNTQSYDIDSSYQPIALNNNNAAGGYDMSSGSVTPPPPSTNTGAPVDASRIGILPKRPVSLVGNSVPANQRRPDSDDELEYAESPFDDRRAAPGPR